jgi:hypothetical protein
MSLFSPLVNLLQRFFPSKPNHQPQPAGADVPKTEESRTGTSPSVSYTPGDQLLKQTLLGQIPDTLPDEGQLFVRMQTVTPGGASWSNMGGVLLCAALPTEKQTEDIVVEASQILQERGRFIIARRKLSCAGLLMLELAYARDIPYGGRNRV